MIKNIVNVIVVGNGLVPMKMSLESRRYFLLWSKLVIKGEDRQVLPEWNKYFKSIWYWIRENKGWMHCVDFLMKRDVSNFDPRESPRVTEDMIDVQNASIDPLKGLFDECVEDELGVFKADLLTLKDIRRGLAQVNSMGMCGFHVRNVPSVNTLGKLLKQTNKIPIVRCYNDRKDVLICCIRNKSNYAALTKSELYAEYRSQYDSALSESTLSVVGG